MVERLGVWAERYEGFVRVGMLTLSDTGKERFSYDESYLRASSSVPIYPILPFPQGTLVPTQRVRRSRPLDPRVPWEGTCASR